MTVRFYLLPVQRVTDAGSVHRGPMYLRWRFNPTGLDVVWSLMDYGSIDLGCVAVNAATADHATLVAQANVYQFPEGIDVKMTVAQRSALSDYLEIHAVPGDWVSAQDTHRTALRTVTGMFLFMQRLTALTGNISPLDWGYELNTRWQNISTEHRAAITQAATSLGYSTAFIRSTTQVRALLKAFADQWGAAPILFGFVTL